MIFQYLTNGTLQTGSDPLKIVYTCLWLIVCAFFAAAIHDFWQTLAARLVKSPTQNTVFPLSGTLRRPDCWITAGCMALFWTGAYKTISTDRMSRPKAMFAALVGPLFNGISAAIAFVLMQLSYLLYDLPISDFADIFTVPFTSLFTVLALTTVFCLFPLPPFDGGVFLAQFLPWDLKDKFLAFDLRITAALFLILSALLARFEIPVAVLGGFYQLLGNIWLTIFGG